MQSERKDLGELSDTGAVDALFALRGLSVADVGCGPGNVARDLCARGATVLAAEPDPIQAEKNRQAPKTAGLTFVEAPAETLPLEQGAVDGVFFFRSLHHVPIDHMDAALAEAARVLKPETGFLCVVEPATTGAHTEVMLPFHDETHVRTQAQAALARTATRLFDGQELYQYAVAARYANFEAFVARMMANSFNSLSRDKVESEPVRTLFEAGRTASGDYLFGQTMLLNVFRRPRP